jgi:hypothetical protein
MNILYILCLSIFFGSCSKLINSKPIEYHGNIEQLVKENCLNCHSPGKRADYLLLNKYSDLIRNGDNIIKWLTNNRMPPYDFKSDLPTQSFRINGVTPLLPLERELLIAFLKNPVIGKKRKEKKRK